MVYVVKQDDTLTAIAQRFGTTVAAILAANPQIDDPSLIIEGQTITIPDAAMPQVPQPVAGQTSYIVQKGDTLFLISQRFGLTLDELIAANKLIEKPDLIFPGQTIIIPAKGQIPIKPLPYGGKNILEPGIPGQKPLSIISATLEDGRVLQGSTEIPTMPAVKLRFDKNVVNDSVWENNKKSISLISEKNESIPLHVTRIEDTVDFSQRMNIFVRPVNPLVPGVSYKLKISPVLESKAGEALGGTTSGQGVTISFQVKGSPAPLG